MICDTSLESVHSVTLLSHPLIFHLFPLSSRLICAASCGHLNPKNKHLINKLTCLCVSCQVSSAPAVHPLLRETLLSQRGRERPVLRGPKVTRGRGASLYAQPSSAPLTLTLASTAGTREGQSHDTEAVHPEQAQFHCMHISYLDGVFSLQL